jgi:hypothetical protein
MVAVTIPLQQQPQQAEARGCENGPIPGPAFNALKHDALVIRKRD